MANARRLFARAASSDPLVSDVPAAGPAATVGRRPAGRGAPIGHVLDGEPGYRRDVQGLRGVAILLVVAYHASLPIPGGFVGVDVFFVISGFVITTIVLRELQSTGTLDLRRFYSRRIRRLLPALAVMLVVVLSASPLLLNPVATQSRAAGTGAAAAMFGANAFLHRFGAGYFGLPVPSNPLFHTWSLGVEEQFYLVFPALFLFAWRVGERISAHRRAVALVLLGGGLLSLVLSATITPGSQSLAFYGSPTRAWEFAAGALLALAADRLRRCRVLVGTSLGAVGALVITLSALLISDTDAFPGTLAAAPVVGTAFVIASGTASSGGVSSLLAARPLVWMGDISYGWYLWHAPLIVFARLLWPTSLWTVRVAATLSLGLAWLSYRFLENPIRYNSRLVGPRLVSVVAVCVLAPLVAAGVLDFSIRFSPIPAGARAAGRLHADAVRDCSDLGPTSSPNPLCTWSVPNAKGSIFLVGDSNAGQFTEGLVRAAKESGRDLTVATKGGCPFADLTFERSQAAGHCRQFFDQTMARLLDVRPSLVFIAAASVLYVHADSAGLVMSPELARTEASRVKAWAQAVRSAVTMLRHAGIPTVVVHAVPYFSDFNVQLCPLIRMRLDPAACGRSKPRTVVAAEQVPARWAELQAVAGEELSAVLDLNGQFCDAQRCATNVNGEWLYRDGNHISVAGALALSDEFSAAIRRYAPPPS